MRRRTRSLCFLFTLLVPVLMPQPASALVARSAGDVCPPAADPCIVSQPVDVVAGSHLDFGLRTLRIEGAGVATFEDGRGSLSCGRFETATTGPAIRARAESSPSSALSILARKRCSGAALPCFVDEDCAGAGTCSSGDGSVVLGGGIAGNAGQPGHVSIRSAGDLSVHAEISLAGNRAVSDGGTLDLVSSRGSVTVSGNVDVAGGGAGLGGSVSISAQADISLLARVTATGGEYDGGSVSLDAGGNVRIAAHVAVDALSGAGAGGEIDVAAGGDIVLGGAAASGTVVLSADGHTSAENDGGDGGAMSFEADGSVHVERNVRLVANAAGPDGFGNTLEFTAERDVDFEGAIVAKGRGAWGGGSLVDIYAGRDVRVGTEAGFELTGAGAGGDLMVEAGEAFSFGGSADVSGGVAGIGGRIVTVSGADTTIAGSWKTDGVESAFTVGEIFVEACRIHLSGRLVNSAAAGRNRILAHDALTMATSASVVASGAGGTNSITHRPDASPSVLNGIAPPPLLSADASLAACAVCGNAVVEPAESCDDGNVLGSDGCSARCQDEGCIAATEGYPARSLCDDSSACTTDRCNAALHQCEYTPADCSDGISCTADSCGEAGCIHLPDDTACDDANVCTTDTCDAGGCVHAPAAAACDDGAFCNGADWCDAGACAAHAGDPCAGGASCSDRCDEALDSCLAPAGSPCDGDANACTDDVCDGSGACAHHANRRSCDDADFCTTGELCEDGECGVGEHPLAVARLRVRPGDAPGEDALAWKSYLAPGRLPDDPATTDLRVVLSDATSRPLADVVLPAGALVRGRTAWRFAPRDGEASFVEKLSIDVSDDGVRLRARLGGLDLSSAMSAPSLRLTLVFGDDPGAACLASARLECRGAKRRLACSSPR
jgi:cysteine-rich repeat protein